MSAGLQVFGDNSIFQIDGQFSNHVVVQTGQGYTNAWLDLPNLIGAAVFFRPRNAPSSETVFYSRVQPSGSWEPPAGKWGISSVYPSTPVLFDYIWIAPASTQSDGAGYGLGVFGENGSLVFSSSFKYFNVSQSIYRSGIQPLLTINVASNEFLLLNSLQVLEAMAEINEDGNQVDTILIVQGAKFLVNQIIVGNMEVQLGGSFSFPAVSVLHETSNTFYTTGFIR